MDWLVAALFVWRVCHLVMHEEGPGHIFAWGRTLTYKYRSLRPLTTCLYCLSMWIGLLAALLYYTGLNWVMLPFALSAAGIFLGIVKRKADTPEGRNVSND